MQSLPPLNINISLLKIKCKCTPDLRRFDTKPILYYSISVVYNLTTDVIFITGK